MKTRSLFLSPLRGLIIFRPEPTACAPSAALRAGCGLHSFAASRLGSRPFKKWRCYAAGERTSGAEARLSVEGLNGTSGTRALPIRLSTFSAEFFGDAKTKCALAHRYSEHCRSV
jgi:hypothetical protein